MATTLAHLSMASGSDGRTANTKKKPMTDRQQRGFLLTRQDAAAAAGVTEATLRDWVRRGLLTRYGTARNSLYDVRELGAALDQPKPRRNTRVA